MPQRKPKILYQYDFKPKGVEPLDRQGPISVRLPSELSDYVRRLPKGERNQWLIKAVQAQIEKEQLTGT